MKRTALLAVVVFLLASGSATAAPKAIKGVVVAKRAHGAVILATGRKGLAVTVRAGSRHLRLGDRVSVTGKRLRDGSIRPSRLHVLSHVTKARIRGMVVRRLAHAMRIASGHSLLTIQTRSRALASHHDGQREGEMGEFEIHFEHGDLVEHGFTAASDSGTVAIEGHLVRVSPLVVSVEGLPIEITVPSGMTLPALTPGQEVELTVQAGAGNVFTLVSIRSGDDQGENEDGNEVEAKGTVTDSTAAQITIDTGDATLTFAAPAGETLPIVAVGTLVEAKGVTINGVLTLTELKTEASGDGGGDG